MSEKLKTNESVGKEARDKESSLLESAGSPLKRGPG